MMIKLVPEEKVEQVWPFVEPLAEKLAEKTQGEHTPESLHKQITEFGHALWVSLTDEGKLISFVTTFITPDGSGRLVGVMLAGAGVTGHLSDWNEAMESAISDWFKDRGCHKIVFVGPRAWYKFFPEYKSKLCVFERKLITEH